MDKIFEVIDKTGRVIYLPNERWTHIVMKHRHLGNYIEHIKETVCKPLFLNTHPLQEDVNYYHRWYKENEKYLVVIVKYLNGGGFIISSFYTKTPKP